MGGSSLEYITQLRWSDALTETFCDIMISVRRVKDVSDEVRQPHYEEISGGAMERRHTHQSVEGLYNPMLRKPFLTMWTQADGDKAKSWISQTLSILHRLKAPKLLHFYICQNICSAYCYYIFNWAKTHALQSKVTKTDSSIYQSVEGFKDLPQRDHVPSCFSR